MKEKRTDVDLTGKFQLRDDCKAIEKIMKKRRTLKMRVHADYVVRVVSYSAAGERRCNFFAIFLYSFFESHGITSSCLL